MKKTALAAAILALLALFSACGEKTEDGEQTKPGQTDEVKAPAVDFERVPVKDYVYAYVEGDEAVTIKTEAEEFVSSKPSVATVKKDGTVVPKAEGVTLVAYEEEGKMKAVAVCVFAEGNKPDRASGQAAEIVFAGDTYMYSATISDAEYYTSNSAVVDVTNAPEFKFVSAGYAYITCASASRPFTYSFIVCDRTVE